MPKGNNKVEGELIQRLEQIRALLEESIALVKKGAPKRLIATSQPTLTRTGRPGKDIDFSMPIRPFVRKYSVGLSGQEKFTLLLAFLAKGDATKRISLEEIEKYWSKMTAKNLLGMEFNRFYSGQAKDNDWVNTEKPGLYYLRPSWRAIFNEKH